MIKGLILQLAAFAAVSTVATAQEEMRADRILSASDLHTHCEASEADEAGRLSIAYCLGAITGIADAAMTLNVALSGRQTICLSSGDSAEKMRFVFLKFVEERPATLDLPAATVVIAALQTSFPCETTK